MPQEDVGNDKALTRGERMAFQTLRVPGRQALDTKCQGQAVPRVKGWLAPASHAGPAGRDTRLRRRATAGRQRKEPWRALDTRPGSPPGGDERGAFAACRGRAVGPHKGHPAAQQRGGKPESAEADGVKVKQHRLPDQIAADK